jgi:hypothetical protein
MPILTPLISFSRRLLRGQQMEKELDDEVRSHLQLLTEQNIEEGLNPHEAARTARIEAIALEDSVSVSIIAWYNVFGFSPNPWISTFSAGCGAYWKSRSVVICFSFVAPSVKIQRLTPPVPLVSTTVLKSKSAVASGGRMPFDASACVEASMVKVASLPQWSMPNHMSVRF